MAGDLAVVVDGVRDRELIAKVPANVAVGTASLRAGRRLLVSLSRSFASLRLECIAEILLILRQDRVTAAPGGVRRTARLSAAKPDATATRTAW
jgi:hypothetical protein